MFIRSSTLCAALTLIAGCGSSMVATGGDPGGPPAVATFTITGVPPTVVATRVGSGPFTAATLASGTVRISLPSGVNNFAVAYACSMSFPPSGTGPAGEVEQHVYEATTLDGNAFTGSCLAGVAPPPSTPATGTLTGSVDATAIPGVSTLAVDATGNGYGSGSYSPFSNASSFGFAAATGSNRVLVLAYDNISSPPASAGSTTLAAAKNFDNQAVPGALNSGNPVVLAPSDETTFAPITYSSLPAGFASEGTTADLVTSFGKIILAAPATAHYPVLPAGATESGDYYSINTIASSGTEVTSITTTSTSAAPVAFAFPAAWVYAGPSPASTPIFNLAYAGFSGASGISYLAYGSWQPLGVGSRDLYFNFIHATGNYLNGGTSITFPDLSSVTGFLSPPVSGTFVNWDASVTQTAYTSQLASPSNATVTSVVNSGRYIVP